VAQLDVWLDRPPEPPPLRTDIAAVEQRVRLAERHDELIQGCYDALVRRLPVIGQFDEHRRKHTRQDLDYILRFADVALLVDDPTLFAEFTAWLTELLAARGVPEHVVDVTLDAVEEELGDALAGVRDLIRAARRDAA